MNSFLNYMAAANVLVFAALYTAPAYSQSAHSDLRFWYEGGKIEIETDNGLNVGTGVFPASGFFQQFESNPGFASETDVNLGVNPSDLLVYNVLGDLRYWAEGAFAAIEEGVQIRINNNLGPDTEIDGGSGAQPGNAEAPLANVIGQASTSGDFHSHVEFQLEPLASVSSPPFGAYGLELSLTTDAEGIADSDPFYFLFNFGLSSPDFDDAVAVFAALLQGPTLPGDFNGDNVVDAADYTVWRDHYGLAEDATVLSGNGDGGVVGDTDYDLWVEHYGETAVSPTAALSRSIPESACSALFLTAAFISLSVKQHRAKTATSSRLAVSHR